MTRGPQFRIRKHTLNCVQQAVVQPAMSAFTSSARAEHTSLQDWKSLLQTRKDWLPRVQAEGVGFSDCVWAWPADAARRSPSASSMILVI